MKSLTVLFVFLFSLVFAGVAFAHNVTKVDVQCANHVIVASAENFEDSIGITVTLTGPNGYSKDFVVEQGSWTHSFPLGGNGSFHLDWANAGENAIDFNVDCAVAPTPTPRPTPTPPHPTPTPHKTLPPTDTE